MRAALRHLFVRTKAGTCVRMEVPNIDLYHRKHAAWFKSNYEIVDIDTKKRLALIRDALDTLAQRSRPGATIFVIGAATQQDLDAYERNKSDAYNHCCREFCRSNARVHFVDMTALVPLDHVISDQHLTPVGYRLLSSHILDVLKSQKNLEPLETIQR